MSKKQLRFLSALSDAAGNVSVACKSSGVESRTTYYRWLQNPDFANAAEAIKDESIDYVESKLMKAISEDNITAIIFYLKTQGKKRGYIETTENQLSLNPFEELMKSLSEEEDE